MTDSQANTAPETTASASTATPTNTGTIGRVLALSVLSVAAGALHMRNLSENQRFEIEADLRAQTSALEIQLAAAVAREKAAYDQNAELNNKYASALDESNQILRAYSNGLGNHVSVAAVEPESLKGFNAKMAQLGSMIDIGSGIHVQIAGCRKAEPNEKAKADQYLLKLTGQNGAVLCEFEVKMPVQAQPPSLQGEVFYNVENIHIHQMNAPALTAALMQTPHPSVDAKTATQGVMFDPSHAPATPRFS